MIFGRPIKEKHVAWWGARAIMENKSFSLLGDRQSADNFNPRFKEWLDKRGLPWMRNEVKRTKLRQSSTEVLTFSEGIYHIEACPNASYGYLYIGAIQKEGDNGTEPFPPIKEIEFCPDCGLMDDEDKFSLVSKLVWSLSGPDRKVCQDCAKKIRIREQRRVRARKRKLSSFP